MSTRHCHVTDMWLTFISQATCHVGYSYMDHFPHIVTYTFLQGRCSYMARSTSVHIGRQYWPCFTHAMIHRGKYPVRWLLSVQKPLPIQVCSFLPIAIRTTIHQHNVTLFLVGIMHHVYMQQLLALFTFHYSLQVQNCDIPPVHYILLLTCFTIGVTCVL